MGRAFGYGRAGHLSEHMTLNKRYTRQMVVDFFARKRDKITLVQARSILDTLHRSDHYPTERTPGSSDITLLRRPKRDSDRLPEEAATEMGCISIGVYFYSQILNKEWSKMAKIKSRTFKRRDTIVPKVAAAKKKLQPIVIDEIHYKLVGHEDRPPGRVRLMFEELSPQDKIDFCNPPIILT